MAEQQPLDCALDLMRRLKPTKIEQDLNALLDLVPALSEELLSSVDQPLKIQQCQKTGNDYLLCDYNRDGDSYRSPWSNQYTPPIQDGAQPSARIRKLEIAANEAFNTYREMYFEGGVSSVYMWDLDEGFAAVVLIKKAGEEGKGQKIQGAWDSIHVVEIQEKNSKLATYKLTSTIMLHMVTSKAGQGTINLAGSMTRQTSQDYPLDNQEICHVQNMGRIIEDMELKMRNALQDVYFGKTRDIVNEVRSDTDLSEVKRQDNVRKELIGKLQEREKK